MLMRSCHYTPSNDQSDLNTGNGRVDVCTTVSNDRESMDIDVRGGTR